MSTSYKYNNYNCPQWPCDFLEGKAITHWQPGAGSDSSRLVRLSACLGNFCPLLRSVGQLLPGSVSFEPGTFVGQAEHVFFCELGCALRRPLELVSLASLEGSQQNMEGCRDRMHQSWHVHDLQVHPRHAQHRLMLWLSGTMHTAFEQQAHYGQVHSIGTQKCRARSGMSLSGANPTDI